MTTDKQRDEDARLGLAALGLIPPRPSDAAVIQAAAGALGGEVVNLPGVHVTAPVYGRQRYPGVTVRLTDGDGNALAIIGAVAKALKREAGREAAAEWTAAAWRCGSYDPLLRLAVSWVDVE